MKLTFTDIIEYCQDGANDTSSTIKTFFKRRIGERYALVTDKLNTFTQTLYRTTSTVEDQQYYYNPPNAGVHLPYLDRISKELFYSFLL